MVDRLIAGTRHNATIKNMFTPKQTAGMLQIATSTLRKYAARYSDHLSDKADRMQRRYNDQDIATLKRIVEYRRNGYSLSDIPDMLGTVLPPPAPAETLSLIPFVAVEFESIRDQFAEIRDDGQDRADQLSIIQDRLAAIEELERERQERQARPWWKKILRR